MFIIFVKELDSSLFLADFKLVWKTATLLALVTVGCCSDLPLLCFDNQHLFPLCHAPIFVPASGSETDQPCHLSPQIHIESLSNLNLCVVFYFKAYLLLYRAFREEVRWILGILSVFGDQ